MNRHIFGISTYFLTFFLSVILVAVFGIKEEPVAEKIVVTSATFTGKPNRNFETVEQREIRKFLETDRSSVRKNHGGKGEREKLIVEDMKNLSKNSSIPMEIKVAYQENIAAWNNLSKHLADKHSEMHNDNGDDYSGIECERLYREINFTYKKVLEAAKNYGVDYR